MPLRYVGCPTIVLGGTQDAPVRGGAGTNTPHPPSDSFLPPHSQETQEVLHLVGRQ